MKRMRNSSSQKVIFDFIDWNITLRELVFSILLVGIMMFIGFLISNKIRENANNRILTYRQAMSINDDDLFKHALNTDAGNAFVNGKLIALEPISHPHVEGKYLHIHIATQKYTKHTEHYTTTDSKGKVHHHTRSYWTWDTIRNEYFNSENVSYCGVMFPFDKFDYGCVDVNTTIYKKGFLSDKREVIRTMPIEFNATTFCKFFNGEMVGKNIMLIPNIGIEDYRNRLMKNHWNLAFWMSWTLLTAFLVFLFYVHENQWLEDVEK